MTIQTESNATEQPLEQQLFSHSISITSKTGVGSSSTLKALRSLLPDITRFVSGGAIMRAMAIEQNMTIDQFCKWRNENWKECNHDRMLDEMLRGYAKGNYTVIESRLAHAWTPHSFHVLLVCDLETRIKRRAAQESKTEDQVRQEMVTRDAHDDETYKHLYGDDVVWQPEQFDLVIDTGVADSSPQVVAQTIVDAHTKWLKENASDIIAAENVVVA